MHLRHDAQDCAACTDAADFGRVAVLLGGRSAEREISLLTGTACSRRCKRRGVDAHGFDPARARSDASSRSEGFERAWITLHGPGGEDGTVQGALEFLGIPYTGSGVLGSALSAWTSCAPSAWPRRSGVPTPSSWCCAPRPTWTLALERSGCR